MIHNHLSRSLLFDDQHQVSFASGNQDDVETIKSFGMLHNSNTNKHTFKTLMKFETAQQVEKENQAQRQGSFGCRIGIRTKRSQMNQTNIPSDSNDYNEQSGSDMTLPTQVMQSNADLFINTLSKSISNEKQREILVSDDKGKDEPTTTTTTTIEANVFQRGRIVEPNVLNKSNSEDRRKYQIDSPSPDFYKNVSSRYVALRNINFQNPMLNQSPPQKLPKVNLKMID